MYEELKKYKIFWQYPVITEKTFYLQNKENPIYAGIPWATILDKNYNITIIAKILKPLMNEFYYVTCCQHIRFRQLFQLFKYLNIRTVYSPHKTIGEDELLGIKIEPCPLYAVNVEDESRNKEFKVLCKEKKYLYSFIGGYNKKWYMSNLRELLLKMNHNKRESVVIDTGNWHFDPVVYNKLQNNKGELNEDDEFKFKTRRYNEVMNNSKYTLCPSGSGPNSIRLWEALAVGSIPVVLSDNLDLPNHELMYDSILKIRESDLYNIGRILRNIPKVEEIRRRKNCIKVYNDLKNNFANTPREVIHYCAGTYYIGDTGGVARYDYQISQLFPLRVFFKGPQEKKEMLEYLKKCKNPVIITDNHLSCDIPNNYNVILVHHGVAKTHAERDEKWDKCWKELCCNGQEKMLYYREPETTRIVTISQFCTDEFNKYYGEVYKRFKIKKIFHGSELNENMYKKKWNKKGIVLGNWANENKGEKVIEKIKDDKYNFKNLSVYPESADFEEYNEKKQKIYLESDIFLQLSLCEGNSYATLDALLCGIPVVASNVGLFYKDVPEDCFVKIEWERNNDIEYIKEKLDYAWKNKEELGRKGREWYLKNSNYKKWKKEMEDYVYN